MVAGHHSREADRMYETVLGDTWDTIAKFVYGSEIHADWLMKNFSLGDLKNFFPSTFKG